MQFPTPLIPARLIRRYKRFLADCRLDDGREVTAHCPNPGSMMGLAEPGTRIWLEPNDDPKKKLKFGWRLVEQGGHFVGIDTALPNRMLKAALEAREVPALAAYGTVRAEVAYGESSRVDFVLRGDGLPDAFVEVKSVTLGRRSGLAEFPDAVTARGASAQPSPQVRPCAGHRAMVLFLVQRSDARRVGVAGDIDPGYAAALAVARAAGVEILCHGTRIGPHGVSLGDVLPFVEGA